MVAAGEPLKRTSFATGTLEADEVVVEIAGCGVCHTDLGYYYDNVPTRHDLPLALGHEISGRIIDAGADAGSWLGRAVIVPAVIPCGTCDLCKRGLSTICAAQKMPGNHIQGGFASHVKVPSHGLCPIDEARLKAVGLELADLSVVADALTTPYQAAIQAGVGEGDLVIVIGAGGVGGYAVQVANALGAHVVAIDIDPRKLEAVGEHGARLTLNAAEQDNRAIRKAVQEYTDANGLRRTEWIIFECSGTPVGQRTAFDLMTLGSTICVVGFTPQKAELLLSKLMVFHARALGNWGCATELYPAALDLVLEGKVTLAPFVEQHPLDTINEIFEMAHAGKLTRRAVMIP
jgi:6-hydroxycyclohex-1-ene-1-carbonyl-CoA dehydrogenase